MTNKDTVADSMFTLDNLSIQHASHLFIYRCKQIQFPKAGIYKYFYCKYVLYE